MTRRCSHCSNNGHNSRTCPTTKGVKLFGVRLTEGAGLMKKSASMGNISHYYSSNSSASPINPDSPDPNHVTDGYASDEPAHTSCSSNCRAERKKGTPWSEEEHRLFLLGLQKLGKGDWRGIARNFVISRTPTQVASHAQKHFIRQNNQNRRKRRTSLFDMVPDMPLDQQPLLEEPDCMSEVAEDENEDRLPTLQLSLERDCEPMETTNTPVEAEETMPYNDQQPVIPAFLPTYLPVSYPSWPPSIVPIVEEKGIDTPHHQVLKPKPILLKKPVNVDELVSMSKLTLGAAATDRLDTSPPSLKLIGSSSRQSAFHINQPVSRSGLSKRDGNAISAA